MEGFKKTICMSNITTLWKHMKLVHVRDTRLETSLKA